MTVRTFLLIGAGLGVVYGVGFVLAPGLMADLYGVKLTEAVAMMDRYFGVGLLGVGLLCWAVRDVTDPDLVSRLLLALGAANLVGIFVSLHATLTHAINGLGWFNVLLYVGLVAGCAYFLRRPTVAYRAG